MTFDPQDRKMHRDRGQILFRYRPGQTFDHSGGYTAQVRQYARDDTYDGPTIDRDYLVGEAMHLVRRWRAEGLYAPSADSGSNRAPEFPADTRLAHQHYEVVIPARCSARSGHASCAAPVRRADSSGRQAIPVPGWTTGRRRVRYAAISMATGSCSSCSSTNAVSCCRCDRQRNAGADTARSVSTTGSAGSRTSAGNASSAACRSTCRPSAPTVPAPGPTS